MEKKINYTATILHYIEKYDRLSLVDLASLINKDPTFVKKIMMEINTEEKTISIKKSNITPQNPTGISYINKKPSNHFDVYIKEYQINLKKQFQHITYYDNKLQKILIYFDDQALKKKEAYSNLDRYDEIKSTIKNSNDIITFIIPKNFLKKYEFDNKNPKYTWKNNCMIIELHENKNIQDLPKLCILILDDLDTTTLNAVHKRLTPKHFVKKFKDQNTVINRLKTKKYDYLILDWIIDNKPLKIKTIMKLLRSKNRKGKAIIITGADYTNDDIAKYYNYGVVGMLHKNTSNLLEKIGDMIWSSYE